MCRRLVDSAFFWFVELTDRSDFALTLKVVATQFQSERGEADCFERQSVRAAAKGWAARSAKCSKTFKVLPYGEKVASPLDKNRIFAT